MSGQPVSQEANATTRRGKQHEANEGKNLQVLLFYTLTVIVISLTAFNFYLFCWIWSSLAGKGSSSISATKWAKMDLVSSWSSIKFNGRVTSKQVLRVERLIGREKLLNISSRSDVSIGRMSREEQKKGDEIKNLPHLADTFIHLDARRRRINFPNGLIVKDALVCAHECELRAPRISLTNERGLDFDGKSMQVRRIQTNRLHSPTNGLNLLSSNRSLFRSEAGKVELLALDELALFSRNSHVSVFHISFAAAH